MTRHKVALLFPGSGSQYVGMGKTFYHHYPVAKQTFEEANDVLGYDLKKICFEGSIIKLNRIENMLPGLLTASVAYFRVYMEVVGAEPHFLAGHSLGEYSALTCAGAVSFADALRIVRKRCFLAEETAKQQKGTMTVIKGLSGQQVQEECQQVSEPGHVVSVAGYNSPVQAIISGHEKAVIQVEKQLLKSAPDTQVIPIIGSAPYHSTLLESTVEQLKEECLQYRWSELQRPVISNVTARPYDPREKVIDMLMLQMVQPVQWQKTIRYLQNQGVEIAVEIGPQNVLKQMTGENTRDIRAFSFDDKRDRQVLETLLKEKDKDKDRQQRIAVLKMCLGAAVSTRNNNEHYDEYEDKVAVSYQEIKQLKNTMEENGGFPSDAQILEALGKLVFIFNAKKTPTQEQILRLNQIRDKTGLTEVFNRFELKEKIVS